MIRLVHLLFALSGAAGLVYQVVWSRLLVEVFGVTVYAVSAVLSTYLAGLALGALVLGPIVDRRDRPLRTYAWLEIGIGIAAVAGTWTITLLEPLHHQVANQLPPDSARLVGFRMLLAALVVLPATFLMGGTLPAVTRTLVGRIQRLGSELSYLYALNTLGAVAGTLLAGFVLIRAIGLLPTLGVAVAVNVVVGLVAFGISPALRLAGSASPSQTAEPKPAGAASPPFLLVAIALTGFVSLALEVLWTRLLVLVVGSAAYAFVTMLSSFLVGIALGSFLAKFFLHRIRDPRAAFGWIQLGIGAAALLTLLVVRAVDVGATQVWIEQLRPDWRALTVARFGLSFGIMLVPTTLMGMTFPLAGTLWARDVQTLGGRLGQIYGANTLGNIAGALIGGFVLLPALGLQKGVAALAVLNLINATWGLIPSAGRRGRLRRGLPLLVAGLGCAALLLTWRPEPFRLLEEQEGDRVLYYNEGVVATVKVIQRADDERDLWMGVDAIKIGQSYRGVDEKQQALAHFPFLLATATPPQRILSIGLGTGIVAGQVARHRSVERMDCLEISPSVIEAAALFASFNDDVLRNPKVRVIADDGVNYLRRTDATYDAVISDAKSRTDHAGNATFFSAEYYRLCREHLAPTGVMLQWVPLTVPPAEFETILRTFVSEFRNTHVWVGPPEACFLVGTEEPLVLDLDRIDELLSGDATEQLRGYGWTDAATFASLFVADHESLRPRLSDRATINTLRHPVLEYYSPADHAVPPNLRAAMNLELLSGIRPDPARTVTLSGAAELVAERARAVLPMLRGAVALQRGGGPGAMDAIEEALRISPEHGVLRFLATRTYYDLGHRASQENVGSGVPLYERALALTPENSPALNPDRARAHNAIGVALLSRRDPREAGRHFFEASRIHPELAEPYCNLGHALAALGGHVEAIEAYRRALERRPGYAAAHQGLGNSLLATGRPGEAVDAYRASLAITPGQPDVLTNLGTALVSLGEVEEGLASYAQASATAPSNPAPLLERAWVLATHSEERFRNPAEALGLAKRGNELTDRRDPQALDVLAAAYAATGDFRGAREVAEVAIEQASARGAERLAQTIAQRLALYERNAPFREPAAAESAQ